MRIVTDEWFFASSKAERLLNTDAFIPHDPDREKEWGFSMSAIVGKSQRNLFEGKVARSFTAIVQSLTEREDPDTIATALLPVSW